MSKQYFSCVEHTISAQHIRGYFKATANSEEEELQIAIKQYIPRDNQEPQTGDVTLVCGHAAGLFKELYEPLFDDLHQESKRRGGFRIRAIWIADVSTHGASGVLNEGLLGIDCKQSRLLCRNTTPVLHLALAHKIIVSWEDHARDLLHMINMFRKEMPKPLVGIGHSMGATNIVQLAIYHPRLFSAIICVEPILNKDHKGMNFAPAYWLTERNDVWASREAAAAGNKKSGLLKTWDPRVVKAFDCHGFRELPTLLYPEVPTRAMAEQVVKDRTKPVTFATTKHHDVRSFSRDCFPRPGEPLSEFQPSRSTHPDISKAEHFQHQQPVYRPEAVQVFCQLRFLRPPCLYVYGNNSTVIGSSPTGRADKLETTGTAVGGSGGAAAGAVAESILEKAGHFVPLEQPANVAEVAALWIDRHLEAWRQETSAQAKSWKSLNTREKAIVSDDWRWWVKEWYARRAKPLRESVVGWKTRPPSKL